MKSPIFGGNPMTISRVLSRRVSRASACRLLVLAVAVLLVGAVRPSAAADKPKVLVIGDSISIGYMKPLVELMKDEADLKHNPGNARHTGIGVEKIDQWLGDTKWDVIHFNWGLHDLCYRNPDSKTQGRRDKVNGQLDLTIEQYEQNLEKLVTRLKQTGAALVWANTTVVPEGEAGRIVGDDLRYNQVAARVMKKHGIPINDLNATSRTFKPELFSGPGNVHFKPEGSQKLAEQVAEHIRQALKRRSDS
jgi:hypothetical protein